MTNIIPDLDPLRVPIETLHQWEQNPRRGDVEAVKRSYERFGQRKPIVARRDGTVIAGNHQLAAAVELGWTHIAVVRVDDTDTEATAFGLADNRTSDLGTYDDETLATLLTGLNDTTLLAATGYTDDDITALLAGLAPEPEAFTDPDDVPATPTIPVTQPGDVWQLGPHRLLCGSALNETDYVTLLNGSRADLIWTDPPYGVDIVGGNHSVPAEERRRKGQKVILNDKLSPTELRDFLTTAFTTMIVHTHAGAAWYVAAPPGPLFEEFGAPLNALGIWRQTIVWLKDLFVMGRSDYHYRHEPIFYGWTPGAAHHAPPTRTIDTVWEYARPKRSAEHPTMKPVALITRAIENSTNPGDLILDPFAGSGSTLIAAHQTSRTAALIELDPTYCDVIAKRYQQHTGTTPTRNGHPHDFTGEA